MRVWRNGVRVAHPPPVDRTESVALEAVLAREIFGRVCEAVAVVESEETAPLSAARILQAWFADGLVVGLDR